MLVHRSQGMGRLPRPVRAAGCMVAALVRDMARLAAGRWLRPGPADHAGSRATGADVRSIVMIPAFGGRADKCPRQARAVLQPKAKLPGAGPGPSLFLKGGGNDPASRDRALDTEGPPRRTWDWLAVFALLFAHAVERLPLVLDGHVKA